MSQRTISIAANDKEIEDIKFDAKMQGLSTSEFLRAVYKTWKKRKEPELKVHDEKTHKKVLARLKKLMTEMNDDPTCHDLLTREQDKVLKGIFQMIMDIKAEINQAHQEGQL